VISLATARELPKLLLHDHLDGGLRTSTILELAEQSGHRLPSTDPDELVAYFRAGADAGDILRYLETFGHTVPLLQTPEALHRVAREAAEDLAADGVIYAEVRFAPELHGMALDAAIEAVVGGFADGGAGRDITVNTIVCAMRTEQRSAEVAEACVRWLASDREAGVVAFDLAGAETGFPPSDHLEALAIARAGLARVTIHASEPPGLELIADALRNGAERIGHGVRLIEDCSFDGDGGLLLGPLARYVRDRQVPLELCPSCNVQIGAVLTLADHPIGPFLRAGFNASINTDNRLMSGVSVSSEVADVAAAFDLSLAEVGRAQQNAVAASFASHAMKAVLSARVASAFDAAD
jgi:adenosine deaminase